MGNSFAPRTSEAPPARTSVAPPERLLVVDDSKTIRKVVCTILERSGYAVVGARDGKEGLERLKSDGPFDLILLDFVMPRMNGYQFCRQLRGDDELAATPVVLMSARAEKIGDRFVEQAGCADALSKPFDARALIAVVGGVLAKTKALGASPLDIRPEEMLDEAELDAQPVSEDPPSRQLRAVDTLANDIVEALAPHLSALRPQDLAIPELLEDAILLALNDATLAKLQTTLEGMDPLAGSTMCLRGDIQQFPLAEIMQLLQLQRWSGVLRVSHRSKLATLYLHQGTIDFVEAHNCDIEFRLGRYLVDRGLSSFEEIEGVVDEAPRSGRMLGEALIDQGKLTDDELRSALAAQSSELVYEVMSWPDGTYALHIEEFPDAAQKAALGLGIGELVLEGFRRVDEWRKMADVVQFEDVVMVDTVALGNMDASKISPEEQKMIEAIDGLRTIREVMENSTLASFDAIRIVYGLLQSRIVRVKKAAATQSQATGT